jgi:uncharacterized protein VirK/YbjX
MGLLLAELCTQSFTQTLTTLQLCRNDIDDEEEEHLIAVQQQNKVTRFILICAYTFIVLSQTLTSLYLGGRYGNDIFITYIETFEN